MALERRMQRSRRLVVGAILALGLASFGTTVDAASATSDVALAGSQGTVATAHLVGPHAGESRLLVSLVLAPRGGSAMDRFIARLQDPASPLYHQWLVTGQFNRRFAPPPDVTGAARSFLAGAGLHLEAAPSPFVVRASGTTAQVERAFNTGIDDYRTTSGRLFYTNAQPARIPSSLAGRVIGVSGLTNTVRMHPQYKLAATAPTPDGSKVPQYGGGPGGSGLTPSQIEGIYSAAAVHAAPNGRGEGTTLAVFELSGYTHTDVRAYQLQFLGTRTSVPVTDVNVDGGPIGPDCPTGDGCGPFDGGSCSNGCNSADYSGDVEVEADIEVQIALAPAADQLLVYNAPNDITGATSVDELFRIANDNVADVMSSSWGLCEPDDTLGVAEAEYVALAQMAAQGQSVFGASGDSGAYDCLGDPAHKGLEVDDPPSQPYMTAVGGSSLGTFDPGSSDHPAYPQGYETVWNPLDKCQGTAKHPVGDGCETTGASGGGVSRFWPRPNYQNGPGVLSGFSQRGPYCSETTNGHRCREIPDVSANADQYTPYAEFCTGDRTTSGAGASSCASYLPGDTVAGWFGIGGTSLSSPVWSAIVDLSVSYHGQRFGEANVGLYRLLRSPQAYAADFHDITGRHQTENNNGFYPTTRAFDMATGIGTPNVSAIAMANP